MGAHSHEPVTVDPQSLESSKTIWNGFTKIAFWGVIHVAVLLLLMAYFLV